MMNDREISKRIAEEYTKFNKRLLKLALNADETGITLTTKAACIYAECKGLRKSEDLVLDNVSDEDDTKENRKKSVRFSCRLTPEDASFVRSAMECAGIESQQELLEEIIIRWAFDAYWGATPKK